MGPALRALATAATVALAGCGGSGSDTTSTTTGTSAATTTVAAASGPLVRICDRRLAREVAPILESHSYRPAPSVRPRPSGNARLSECALGPVDLTVDAAPDAVQRYQNRIVETAQFSESIPSRVPRTVRGVGDPDLGAAGANWIPFLRQLLSARGKRVLIAEVHGGGLSDSQRLAATTAISLAVWDRL